MADKVLNKQPTTTTGTVKWFSGQRGFGFIAPDDGGDDLFVHQTKILSEGFRTLREAQQVEFVVETGEDGRSKAVDVTFIAEVKVGERGRGRRMGHGGMGHGGYGRGDWRRKNAGEYSGGTECYNCGGTGHFARDCFVGGGGGSHSVGYSRRVRGSGGGGRGYNSGNGGDRDYSGGIGSKGNGGGSGGGDKSYGGGSGSGSRVYVGGGEDSGKSYGGGRGGGRRGYDRGGDSGDRGYGGDGRGDGGEVRGHGGDSRGRGNGGSGTCYSSGSWGNDSGGRRSYGECYNCGKEGHFARDCPNAQN